MIDISFWGSPQLSREILQALIDDARFRVRYIVTQPDKPRSKRGREVMSSPVKALALKNNIKVFSPISLKNEKEILIEEFSKLPVMLHVILAYGKIIPKALFELPTLGSVNFHASLLPRWRGASPVEAVLMHGDETTGWTMQRIVSKMDAGDIYQSSQWPISWSDTSLSLFEKLTVELKSVAGHWLHSYAQGELHPQQQDENAVTHCGKLDGNSGYITLEEDHLTIRRLAAALSLRGAIYIKRQEKKLKLFIDFSIKSSQYQKAEAVKTGTIVAIKDNIVWLQCSDGYSLPIEALQPEGKKRISAPDFVNGYRLKLNDSIFS